MFLKINIIYWLILIRIIQKISYKFLINFIWKFQQVDILRVYVILILIFHNNYVVIIDILLAYIIEIKINKITLGSVINIIVKILILKKKLMS